MKKLKISNQAMSIIVLIANMITFLVISYAVFCLDNSGWWFLLYILTHKNYE